MGVYIKDMEMPKDYAVVVIYKDGTVRRYEDFVETVGGVIGKATPVLPHGRLIDADAIPYKKIMLDEDDEFYYGVTQPYIDRMPTIIEADGNLQYDSVNANNSEVIANSKAEGEE